MTCFLHVTFQCGIPECSETGQMHKLTTEEIFLVKVRKNVQVEVLCDTHYVGSVKKFSFFQLSCSDPYEVHTKKSMYRLSEVTMDMYKHDSKLVPGRKICQHCKDKVRQQMEKAVTEQMEVQGGGEGEEQGGGEGGEGGGGLLGGDFESSFQNDGGEGNSQQSQYSTTSYHPWSQEFNEEQGMGKVNRALGVLELSPFKKSEVESNSRLEKKLDCVRESIRKHLNVGPSAPVNSDSAGFCESLCTRFRTAPDRNERYKILTSCPENWSAYKISKTFACSYTMAKDAINLRQLFGPGCYPGLKQGHKIPAEVTQKVLDFYRAQDISRELPGQRDCLTVRTGGVREVRQKRLLLLGLREAYAQFKEDHPTCVIGFSTFATLRPKEVVLPGAYIL